MARSEVRPSYRRSRYFRDLSPEAGLSPGSPLYKEICTVFAVHRIENHTVLCEVTRRPARACSTRFAVISHVDLVARLVCMSDARRRSLPANYVFSRFRTTWPSRLGRQPADRPMKRAPFVVNYKRAVALTFARAI